MSCGAAEYEHVTIDGRAQVKPCRYCGLAIVWGMSIKGKPSPADPDTLRNHWITCAKSPNKKSEYLIRTT